MLNPQGGAPRSLLRGVGGWSAVTLCLVGSSQGVLTGLLPGIAIAYQLTAAPLVSDPIPPTVVVPYLQLGLGILGLVLLAGGLAWLTTRPQLLTQRRLG